MNELISAEDQNKLSRLSVGIYGNHFPAEILIANLVGLGVQDIGCFGERADRLLPDEFIQKNNSRLDLYFEDFGEEYDFQINGGDADFVLEQTGILGGIEAAVIADEIRKRTAPLSKFDLPLETKLSYDVKGILRRKVLAIGAGGIGNYFCLGAELIGHDVRLVDDDTFEETNKNRQIFCRVGEPKVNVISERLSCVEGIQRKFDLEYISELEREGYLPEVVVGCVDNIPTRNLIREYALEREIPYYDGGVEITFGKIKLSPDKKLLPQKIMTKKETSCQYKPNPSVVIPNCIVGLKLAECAGQNYSEYEFYFDSESPSRMREIAK